MFIDKYLTDDVEPGSVLFFFEASEDNVVKSVYQDEDCTLPHPNPLQADANGKFPELYLDGTTDDYAIELQNSRGESVLKVSNLAADVEEIELVTDITEELI